jgi:hypothetical protein
MVRVCLGGLGDRACSAASAYGLEVRFEEGGRERRKKNGPAPGVHGVPAHSGRT